MITIHTIIIKIEIEKFLKYLSEIEYCITPIDNPQILQHDELMQLIDDYVETVKQNVEEELI